MKKSKPLILLSLFTLFLIAIVVFADLAEVFRYSDLPFFIAFFLYGIVTLIQLSSSRTSFILSLLFLLYTGLSYIPTGPSRTTERFAEWFYLFFVFGLVQYGREVWRAQRFPK